MAAHELPHTIQRLAGGGQIVEQHRELVLVQRLVHVSDICLEHVEQVILLRDHETVAVGVALGFDEIDPFRDLQALREVVVRAIGIRYSKMTHPDVDNIYTHRGRLRSTEDETTNTATVSAENQADLSAEWKTDQIVVETMAKSGTWESVGDNIRRVKWTVIVNEEALVSMAGRTIVDKLSAANSGYTTYDTETPVRITVTDRIGNTVVRTIAWDNADDDFEYTSTATDDYWTYTFPSDDGCASYKFEYATLVDVTGMTNNPVIENSITNGYTVYGGVGVPAGSAKFGLQKAVDTEAAGNTTGWTEDYAYWKLTIKVPAVGSIEAHLCEVLPMVAYDGSYLYDELDKQNHAGQEMILTIPER